jgi:hypothetical protein
MRDFDAVSGAAQAAPASQHSNGHGPHAQVLEPVEALAERYGLKRQVVKGEVEWHGANPSGHGAQTDGFILNGDGTAWDRALDRRYTSPEVAELCGLRPEQYAPVVEWRARHPLDQQKRATLRGTPKPAPAATPAPSSKPKPPKGEKPKPVKYFDYTSEEGALLFQTVRREYSNGAKDFRQRQPEGNGWAWNLDGVSLVLYKLSQVLAASTVYLVEGEECAEALNAALEEAGLTPEHFATTAPLGAGKWRDEYSEALDGKRVIFLPDNDAAGRKHLDKAAPLIAPRAASLQVLELPGLGEAGDVKDFLEELGTVKQVLELAEAAPEWEPEASEEEPQEEARPRFQILSSEEVKLRPDPQWLVENYLVENTLAAMIAEFESFKSFICMGIAGAIANGLRWYGWKTQKRPVLIVSGEGSGGLKARVMGWETHFDSPMNCFFLPEAVQMLDFSAVVAFVEAVRDLPEPPGLIVLDTVARCLVGGDENSAKDMGLFVAGADYIRKETGAAVLLVHHVGKNGDTRGSTALPGAVETIIRVRRDGDRVKLECEKQKDAEHFEPLHLIKRVVELPQGKSSLVFTVDHTPEAKPESKAERVKEQMLAILRAEFPPEGARAKDWQEKCENAKLGKSRTFHNHVEDMTGDQIEKVNGLWKIKGAESTASTAKTGNAVQMHQDAQADEVLQKSTAIPPPYRGDCSTCSTGVPEGFTEENEPSAQEEATTLFAHTNTAKQPGHKSSRAQSEPYAAENLRGEL